MITITSNKGDSNLKDVRIAALCSLAFAGFFRYNELCNIAPNHIELHSQYIKILCLVVRLIFIGKVTMSI